MDNTMIVSRLQQLGRHFPSVPKNLESAPVRVAVTGAAGQIGAFLCNFIAQGRMFGPYQKVILQLLGLPQAEGGLEWRSSLRRRSEAAQASSSGFAQCSSGPRVLS